MKNNIRTNILYLVLIIAVATLCIIGLCAFMNWGDTLTSSISDVLLS